MGKFELEHIFIEGEARGFFFHFFFMTSTFIYFFVVLFIF